jgi:hypothetical protein
MILPKLNMGGEVRKNKNSEGRKFRRVKLERAEVHEG